MTDKLVLALKMGFKSEQIIGCGWIVLWKTKCCDCCGHTPHADPAPQRFIRSGSAGCHQQAAGQPSHHRSAAAAGIAGRGRNHTVALALDEAAMLAALPSGEDLLTYCSPTAIMARIMMAEPV